MKKSAEMINFEVITPYNYAFYDVNCHYGRYCEYR